MVRKVTDDIFLIKIPYFNKMGETNCYLMKGDKGYTLIDAGYYSEESVELWKHVIDSGYPIEKVVMTHVHEDHIGFAKWFKETYDIPIFVGKLGENLMQKRRHPNLREKVMGLMRNHGIKNPTRRKRNTRWFYDFAPDELFEEGDCIQLGNDEYEIIWTPGHSYDHYCFYQRNKRIMIAGDHILNKISPVIGLWEGEEINMLNDYFASLEKIAKYPAQLALPGHGELITQFQERVTAIKQNHDKRLKQVLQIVSNESKSALEVAKEIYGEMPDELFISQFMATLTRLIYLEENQSVVRERENNVYRFRRV